MKTTKIENHGRAKFIHSLRAKHTTKRVALEKAQAKFDVTPSLFKRIWARASRGDHSNN